VVALEQKGVIAEVCGEKEAVVEDTKDESV